MVNPLKVLLFEPYLTLRDWVKPAQEPALLSGAFVKGINLGGEAVAIGGDRWQSYTEALAAGLVTPGATAANSYLVPKPYARRGTRAMLNSVIFKKQILEIEQPLPNDSYDLYLWMMENYQTHWHTLELRVAGRSVAQGIGYLPFRGWARYGPYPTTVTDGRLHLSLTTSDPNIDAHLMGMSLHKCL
ncbi:MULTISPECIES: hypothetical protein [Cyanophyceae]|uniref:Uncharacterized protein n=1 Tax=Leptolyngbya subtilissima DQ-A4 TaxID=2933933 RepID=A0ABV0JZY9_9CYAN|nr:hypothetical protein [Nodosilinea sp. FACHB-141]MBD2110390.1 hypothetical protein [Nodosilinea sp. FACHB-141]